MLLVCADVVFEVEKRLNCMSTSFRKFIVYVFPCTYKI
jgi:hypothetical protein